MLNGGNEPSIAEPSCSSWAEEAIVVACDLTNAAECQTAPAAICL
jgi:hypothetical protein